MNSELIDQKRERGSRTRERLWRMFGCALVLTVCALSSCTLGHGIDPPSMSTGDADTGTGIGSGTGGTSSSGSGGAPAMTTSETGMSGGSGGELTTGGVGGESTDMGGGGAFIDCVSDAESEAGQSDCEEEP